MGSVRTIVVDGLSALQGGGQTYLKNLFAHLDNFDDLRVVAVLPTGFKDALAAHSRAEVIAPRFASANLPQRVLWSATVLPNLLRRLRANVLYCPGGMLSTRRLGKCKSAVAFRNMLPFASLEWQRYRFGYMYTRIRVLRHLQGTSFRDADLVIFISEYAKSVIDREVPTRKGRSVVIQHGLNEQFRPGRSLPRPDNLPERYVLYVSILDVYKAQLEVIQAWHRLRARRPTPEKLVLVGPEYYPYGKKVRALIEALGLQNEVILTGNVPYHALPAYYQNATVNLFASSCENCPNILLEALAAGRPVLSSNYPPMPEFAGDAATYFDPYAPGELTNLLERYLEDDVLRDRMGAAALRQSERFQWAESTRRTWAALRELAEERCAG